MTRRFRIEMPAEGRGPNGAPIARRAGPALPDGRVRAGEGTAAGRGSTSTDSTDAAHELERVQTELLAVTRAISVAKREIRCLRGAAGSDGMHRASGELDAVASATERATTAILGAVEDIESAANALRTGELDPVGMRQVSTIIDRVILLYETCNFQDLTGQRIDKVVGVLKFVEDRLDVLSAGWGLRPEAGQGAAGVAPSRATRDGTGPLSGPGLPGDERVSQSDIDAYFI